MSLRKDFLLNPINYVLSTEFDQTDDQLEELYDFIVDEVYNFKNKKGKPTSHGTQSFVRQTLIRKYPKFATFYPLKNWKEKDPKRENGVLTYDSKIIDKTFSSSLESYCKSVTKRVAKLRQKDKKVATKISGDLNKFANSSTGLETLYETLNIDETETSKTLSYTEVFKYVELAKQFGVKVLSKGDLQIQF